jgi:hypothetical protein
MPNDYSWIVDLAIADSTSEILNYEKHSDPRIILKEESLNLLVKLNLHFFQYAEVFNNKIKSSSTSLKVMGITNKQSFLVFRKNYRLVVSIYEPGVILFSFDNFSGNIYTNLKQTDDPLTADEVYNSGNILVGKLGPFGELAWTFEEQVVEPEKVVRHYFSEFIKASTNLMKNAHLLSISPNKKQTSIMQP